MFKVFLTFAALSTLAVGATTKRVRCPDGKNTATNGACCAFFALRDELQSEEHFNGQCNEEVHEILRLTFHDAIGISKSGHKGGGADGSILIFDSIETNYHANLGTSDAVNDLKPLLSKHNVTAGDLIQFAAAVGITNCPGAPRLQFLAGRRNATSPADDGLVPEPQDDVTKILARMADAGISATDTINLLASHSIARADHVDPQLDAVPFDSTPFTFDTQFYLEVLLKGTGFPGSPNNPGEAKSPLPDAGELRLQSDFALARDSRTACTWQGFVNQQEKMMDAFKLSMAKLSITGHSARDLIDCSEVIPQPLPPVKKPATFPATKTKADLELTCKSKPFPSLKTDPGQPSKIPACPNGGTDADEC